MRMRLMGRVFVSTVGAIVVVALALASSAHPTSPGRNGLIAFVTHTYSADVGEGIAGCVALRSVWLRSRE